MRPSLSPISHTFVHKRHVSRPRAEVVVLDERRLLHSRHAARYGGWNDAVVRTRHRRSRCAKRSTFSQLGLSVTAYVNNLRWESLRIHPTFICTGCPIDRRRNSARNPPLRSRTCWCRVCTQSYCLRGVPRHYLGTCPGMQRTIPHLARHSHVFLGLHASARRRRRHDPAIDQARARV